MKRKIVATVIVLVVAIAVLGAGIFLRSLQQGGSEADTLPDGSLPAVSGGSSGAVAPSDTVSDGGIATTMVLAQNPVADYAVDGQGNLLALETDGQISMMSSSTRTVVDASHIGMVAGAAFAPDGSKVAVELAAGASIAQWNIFDFQKRAWLPIAFSASAIAWSPSNSQLAYVGAGDQMNTISVLDLSGPAVRTKTVVRLSALDITLQWPTAQHLIVAEKSAAAAEGSAWDLNVTNGTIFPLADRQAGMEILGGPAANLLFQAGTVRGGKLSLTSTSGRPTATLAFLTLPSKCVFWSQLLAGSGTATSTATSSTTSSPKIASSTVATLPQKNYLLCAIPRDAQSLGFRTLPDEYQQLAFFSADSLYKIDVSTGQVFVILNNQAQDFDATNLKVFRTSLYFVNRIDQKVYSIPLQGAR